MKRYIFPLILSLFCLGSCGFIESKSKNNPAARQKTNTAGLTSPDALMDVVIPDEIPSQIKDYTGFRLSFNKNNSTPNWVAWELLPEETHGQMSRKGKRFWQDKTMEGCATTNDYKRSGYDRGHICPAADQKWSEEAIHDSFVMTNICPQDENLNQRAWNTLEGKERLWASRLGGLIIVSGPIYTKADTKRIGYQGVRVPSAFYKVMLAHRQDSPIAIGFIYPNAASPGNMRNYSMTVDKVEEITGFDFFSALPDDLENKVESETSFNEWNHE